MKKLLLLFSIAFSVVAYAQEVDWIDISALHFVATGGTDEEHALRQFLMFDEETTDSDNPVFSDLQTFYDEYSLQIMHSESDDYIKSIDESIESLKKSAEMMPDNKEEFEAQIRQMEEMRAEILKMGNGAPDKLSVDPSKLLKEVTALAVNKKAYTGYKDIGGGLFAVTEAPFYDSIKDSGYNKLDRPDECIYTWGAIDCKGKTVIPAEYDSFLYYSPEQDYILLFCKDDKGNVRCGIRGFDGRIRLPFIYEDEYSTSYDTGISVFKKDGKLGMIDYDGKIYQPFEYSYADMFSHGWIVSKDDKNYGVVSNEGKLVVPMKYKSYWETEDSVFKLERFDGRLDIFDDSYKLVRTEDKPRYD